MELESLEFKVVMDDGPDTEVLVRAASLDIASAAYMAAIARYRLRNVQLRHGARIIRSHDGEPRPEPPPDPNLKSWSVGLIGGKKMQRLGIVEAVTEEAAADRAVALFGLDNQRRRRLTRRRAGQRHRRRWATRLRVGRLARRGGLPRQLRSCRRCH